MRYAVFSDIHANLEALEAVLAKIDELAQQEPIDQIWFLGDLVGYGPNPNECIVKLCERTHVMIAGNHDWAAVSKIDLDDFSPAARQSAEWTAKQLTKEHYDFLTQLPERLEIGECTLVHGSPYGPLWEYLTSEALAERSFEHFTSRYCLVGHTHLPLIFQQPHALASVPTPSLGDTEQNQVPIALSQENGKQGDTTEDDDDETIKMVALRPMAQAVRESTPTEHAAIETDSLQTHDITDTVQEQPDDDVDSPKELSSSKQTAQNECQGSGHQIDAITPEEEIASAENRLNSEIEELLALLGLSQSMIRITNEKVVPHEGLWQAPKGYRAIINPGGVGQPRDGDPRAAFLIYDTERGFTFYRVPYAYQKTQEKIIQAGLPSYLALRLAYGR
jgi:diadenosine tetraphosphatase ApaH/serine/threonine PP2A family protein phosphatase